jgi:ketosteroid isomerase-like protein
MQIPRFRFPLSCSLGTTLIMLSGRSAPIQAQELSDLTAVARIVERYHEALAAGDSAAALSLLSPSALILESGGVETLQEYRAHHLPADISFARQVKSTRSSVGVTIRGDVAWTSATSISRGKFMGKPVNSAGAELMVLTRSRSGWTINALHWSSRDLTER